MYSSIMYASGASANEFWLGEVDSTGKITGFTDFALSQPLPSYADDVFYYVIVDDSSGESTVTIVETLKVFPKSDQSPPLYEMVETGMVDPISTANMLLLMYSNPKH